MKSEENIPLRPNKNLQPLPSNKSLCYAVKSKENETAWDDVILDQSSDESSVVRNLETMESMFSNERHLQKQISNDRIRRR